MKTLEKLFLLQSFNKQIDVSLKDISLWEDIEYTNHSVFYNTDDFVMIQNARDDFDDFEHNIKNREGFLSDKFKENLLNPNLKFEEFYFKNSDYMIIDVISLDGDILVWSLFED